MSFGAVRYGSGRYRGSASGEITLPSTLTALTVGGTAVRLWWSSFGIGAISVQRKAPGGSFAAIGTGEDYYKDSSPLAVGIYRVAVTINGDTYYSGEATADFSTDPVWADMGGLDLWYSADSFFDGVWHDRSGNDNDAPMAASGALVTAPAGTIGLNDQPTVECPGGANDYCQVASVGQYSGNAGLTAWWVGEAALDVPGGSWAVGTDLTGDRGWALGIGSDGRAMWIIPTAATTRALRPGDLVKLVGMPAILRGRYNGATGEQSVWVNGIADDGTLDGSTPATIGNDGADLRLLPGTLKGHTAEIIVFTSALSDADCEAIETELLATYALYQFERTAVSPNLTQVNQGITFDGTYFYTFDNDRIAKWDTSWNELAENDAPHTGLPTIHMSDGACIGGILYVWADDDATDTYLLTFATSNLARLSATQIAGGGGVIAIDGDSRILYSEGWDDVTVVLRYGLDDLVQLSDVELDGSVPYAQGMFFDGDGKLYVACGGHAISTYKGLIYQVDLSTGAVRPVFRRYLADGVDPEPSGTVLSGSTLFWGMLFALGHNFETWNTTLPPITVSGAPVGAIISAAATGAGEITVSQSSPPVGATSRALYGASSAADLPIGGPGVNADLLDGSWDGTDYIEAGLGYAETRYYAEYSTNADGTTRSNVASATTAGQALPTPGVIAASHTAVGEITVTQVTAPVDADTRVLYSAGAAADLPAGGPGAGANILASPWDGSATIEDELGTPTTRYYAEYATNEAGTVRSNVASASTAAENLLSVGAVTDTTAALIFKYDVDIDAVEYIVYKDGIQDQTITIVEAEELSPFIWLVEDLLSSTAYTAKARGRDRATQIFGDWSNTVSFTTQATYVWINMGGFTAPFEFSVLSGLITLAWDLTDDRYDPHKNWIATSLTVANFTGDPPVVLKTEGPDFPAIGSMQVNLDLYSDPQQPLISFRIEGRVSGESYRGFRDIIIYNQNSEWSLDQYLNNGIDDLCWDARWSHGDGEYWRLIDDGTGFAHTIYVKKGDVGHWLRCASGRDPALDPPELVATLVVAAGKAMGIARGGMFWFDLNLQVEGFGIAIDLFDSEDRRAVTVEGYVGIPNWGIWPPCIADTKAMSSTTTGIDVYAVPATVDAAPGSPLFRRFFGGPVIGRWPGECPIEGTWLAVGFSFARIGAGPYWTLSVWGGSSGGHITNPGDQAEAISANEYTVYLPEGLGCSPHIEFRAVNYYYNDSISSSGTIAPMGAKIIYDGEPCVGGGYEPPDSGDLPPTVPVPEVEVTVLCGDVTVEGFWSEGMPGPIQSATLTITRVDTGAVVYSDTQEGAALWEFEHGIHTLPYYVELEAVISIIGEDGIESEPSAATQFGIDYRWEDCFMAGIRGVRRILFGEPGGATPAIQTVMSPKRQIIFGEPE